MWAWLALALVACHPKHGGLDLTGTDAFRNGDLVLRCGMGAESRVVCERSRSTFSHIGILQQDPATGQWNVLHAVPGESGRGPEWLKAEPIEVFFGPDRACKGAWMRVNCSDSVAERAADYCRTKVEEHVLFDNDYLLGDTTELYCCELVWRAYLMQGIDISGGKRYSVPEVFCDEGECIFPCNIEENETTLFIQPFKNKTL